MRRKSIIYVTGHEQVMTPFFSIIIPTYNSEDRIKRTIESIERQEFCSYEIIIVDAKSDDDFMALLKDLERKYDNVAIISEKDNGIYDAMNKGTEIATGDYFLFLGAGDYLIDHTILKKLYEYAKNSLIDIIYGYVLADSGTQKARFERHMNFWYTVRFKGICHQAVVARSDLFIEKKFDLSYKICSDQDWLMYMYKMNKRIEFIDEAIAVWPLDGISNSMEGIKLAIREKFIIQRKYYPVRAFIHYILWVGKMLITKLK